MLLHLVSLETSDALERYQAIRNELASFSKELVAKEEWIIFTKLDLVDKDYFAEIKKFIDKNMNRVFVISTETGEGVKELSDELVKSLRQS